MSGGDQSGGRRMDGYSLSTSPGRSAFRERLAQQRHERIDMLGAGRTPVNEMERENVVNELQAAVEAAEAGDEAASLLVYALREVEDLKTSFRLQIETELRCEAARLHESYTRQAQHQERAYEERLMSLTETHARERERFQNDKLWWEEERAGLCEERARLLAVLAKR